MMPVLSTPVTPPTMPFKVDFATGIVTLGSCFADEIAARMMDADFHVEQNPFGTLYNPASIAAALTRLIEDCPIGRDDLVKHEDLWHSWHHHSSFSHATPGATLVACNSRIHRAHLALRDASLLMVTLGTAWVFEREGKVVANCHKLPPWEFVRRKMTVEEIVALWTPLLLQLQAYFPQMHLLFSVSPIRHMADGAHGNQLSKSTLLLAVDELVARHRSFVSYFPAYEIVLDELRDYRFFDEKMTHPTSVAVDIVWERFQRAAMVPAVRQQAQYNAKQHKREKHIPLHQ